MSFWGHLGIILASFWGCFGIVLNPFWGRFWPLFGLFLDHFSPFYHARESMPISAKIHQNYTNLCENWPFFGYKTLVLLKKRSKSTFQPMIVRSGWVCREASWVDSECFYALIWRSRWLLNGCLVTFYPFNHLEPFWTKNGSKMTPKNGQKTAKNRSLGWFWGIFGRSGSFWGHLGIIMVSFWGHFGFVFDLIFGPFSCVFDHFGAVVSPF